MTTTTTTTAPHRPAAPCPPWCGEGDNHDWDDRGIYHFLAGATIDYAAGESTGELPGEPIVTSLFLDPGDTEPWIELGQGAQTLHLTVSEAAALRDALAELTAAAAAT